MSILLDPVFSLCVHYIEGSPLLDSDLARTRAESAMAIFMLSNKFCADADAEDTKTILQQFSIRRFMITNGAASAKDALFCLQLLRPENVKHLGDDAEDNDKQLVLCLNEMKMGALAKACLYPGTSTLIFNLLSSFADDGDDEGAGGNRDALTEEDEMGSWLEEYQKGCGWEIYMTELSESFVGQKFSTLSHTLYNKLGVVLFALRITDKKGRAHTRVVLNPADFRIPPKDDYDVEGFVIAENKKQSDLSFSSDGSSSMSGSNAGLGGRLQNLADDIMGRRDSLSSTDSGSRRMSLVKQNSFNWRVIKSDYETDRESMLNNQEQLSKQEDEFLRSNYFVRSVSQTLQEATIHTSVLDEIPNVAQHIIIIGKGLGNIYDFIRPWRAKYLGRLRHIVILSPELINDAVWRRISIFEGILFVKGSSLEESDLRRAGIFRAAQVIVLADTAISGTQGSAQSSADALEDADTIFSYQLVRRLNEKAHVVVEIIHSTNVGYLDNTGGTTLLQNDDYKFTAEFASGMLYTSSVLDTLLCQVIIATLIMNEYHLAISLNISGLLQPSNHSYCK